MEHDVEEKLKSKVKQNGGIALKLVSPGYAGMPDRLVIFPFGKLAFIELKAPKKKPRKLQVVRHMMLRGYGFKVYVVDEVKKIDEIIKEIKEDEP